MGDFRNKLIHDYFALDIEVVWKTATEDAPLLLSNRRIGGGSLKIQFDEQQQYQLDAVNAVLDLFDGQPLA